MLHDLLTEPLLTWRDAEGNRARGTLPMVLASLAAGRLADFPRVRTHQFHPWSMFLTQLAAIALHRARRSDPPLDEAEWRHLLLELTEGQHEAWALVVEDLTRAAFFQPPVPERSVVNWKTKDFPDDSDVLATAKAHDIKASLVSPTDAEAWAYALMTLQTTQGFYGAGKYGISRMNGGHGSRSRVGYAPGLAVAARFSRDLDVLLDEWDALTRRGYRDQGVALAWTVPWDGKASLGATQLSPNYIEICRRLRITSAGGRLTFHETTTESRRCLRESKAGDVGDPWIPIDRRKGAALSVTGRGFHYELIARVLFSGDYEHPAALRLLAKDPDPICAIASVLARGEGGTEGLHERVIVLPGPVRSRLMAHPDLLGRRAAEWVQRAEQMRSRVLRPALKKLGQAGPDAFDARVDDIFFDRLFETIENDDEHATLAWEMVLRDVARREVDRAIERCAFPSVRRYKAISEAERTFASLLKKTFPDAHAAAYQAQGASL